jgi:hypothetical protein
MSIGVVVAPAGDDLRHVAVILPEGGFEFIGHKAYTCHVSRSLGGLLSFKASSSGTEFNDFPVDFHLGTTALREKDGCDFFP